MPDYGFRSNGFILVAVALGFVLMISSIITGVTIGIALSRGLPIRTFTGTKSYVLSIADDFLLPLVCGIMLVICGFRLLKREQLSLYRSVKNSSRRAVKEQKSRVIDTMLSQDEKKMVGLIKQTKGGALQSDLVIKSGYSNVKVHRILKSLENKDVIKRGRLGITNKVMIN